MNQPPCREVSVSEGPPRLAETGASSGPLAFKCCWELRFLGNGAHTDSGENAQAVPGRRAGLFRQ